MSGQPHSQHCGDVRCGGSGELIEDLTPHLDHRDPRNRTREYECPGCPDCAFDYGIGILVQPEPPALRENQS